MCLSDEKEREKLGFLIHHWCLVLVFCQSRLQHKKCRCNVSHHSNSLKRKFVVLPPYSQTSFRIKIWSEAEQIISERRGKAEPVSFEKASCNILSDTWLADRKEVSHLHTVYYFFQRLCQQKTISERYDSIVVEVKQKIS